MARRRLRQAGQAQAWRSLPVDERLIYALVEGIAEQFAGGRFDGTIDMRIGVKHWLLSDGTAADAGRGLLDGPHQVITTSWPSPRFPTIFVALAALTYLACAYGPKMMSPTGLAKNKGTDNAQTYLTTHDVGTGPDQWQVNAVLAIHPAVVEPAVIAHEVLVHLLVRPRTQAHDLIVARFDDHVLLRFPRLFIVAIR